MYHKLTWIVRFQENSILKALSILKLSNVERYEESAIEFQWKYIKMSYGVTFDVLLAFESLFIYKNGIISNSFELFMLIFTSNKTFYQIHHWNTCKLFFFQKSSLINKVLNMSLLQWSLHSDFFSFKVYFIISMRIETNI